MTILKFLSQSVLLIFLLINTVQANDKKFNSSKQIWLQFSGTNYCRHGQCADNIPHRALKAALKNYKKNINQIDNHEYLGIIDFSLKSTQKRFFILNLSNGSVEAMLVTHGKNSETELGVAGVFSNVIDSEMSSLGNYITDTDSYIGKHGVSLRLDGISETNSNALIRNIVLHSADYATQWFADDKGRLGLSQGCPAVAPEKIESVIAKLKGHALLYIHDDEFSSK
jgi:hypothetical protein